MPDRTDSGYSADISSTDDEEQQPRPHRCNGALKSSYDPRDWIFEQLMKGPGGYYLDLPDEFHLHQYECPVREQGSRGTCAAISGATMIEIKCKMRGSKKIGHMSAEFIYYHRSNKPASGMFGRNVFQVLKEYGTVPEDMYPYQSKDNQAPVPSKRIMQKAAKYRIDGYARINTVEGLKRALVELGPCYISLPLYETRPQFWRPGSVEPEGHALVVVGYNREGFILRNSWGHDWNDAGHIVFPYSDWDCQLECWTCIESRDTHKKKSRCTIS